MKFNMLMFAVEATFLSDLFERRVRRSYTHTKGRREDSNKRESSRRPLRFCRLSQ